MEALRAAPASADEVEELIDLWRDVGDGAPLAIEPEWDAYTDNLELAWTSEDDQEALASTFAAEQSTVAIAAWLSDTCGIDFGPVTTIVPGTIPAASLPGAAAPRRRRQPRRADPSVTCRDIRPVTLGWPETLGWAGQRISPRRTITWSQRP